MTRLGSWNAARRCGAAIALVLLASSARADVRQIVLLQSFERGNLVLDRFTATLRARLNERAAEPLTFTEFVVNPAGFSEAPEQAMDDFLRAAFAGRARPDLVITTGGAAAAFLQRHRARLFPESPVLYASMDQRFLGNSFTDRETAVAVALDPAGDIDAIVRLFPATENVFVVVGGGVLGRFWRSVLDREVNTLRNRLKFIWSDGMSYAAMLQQASTLPPRSVIFFTSTFEVDANGATYSTERVLADLHARADAPIFGMLSAELGRGAIGGRVIDIEALSRTTADVAFQILAGTTPALIKTPVQRPGPPVFDWRELQRWGIDERTLPPGSVVQFRGPSLWHEFRGQVLGALAVIVALLALVAGLLYERRARQRAELEKRQQLTISAHLERQVAMGEMASALAHELSQPLGAIQFNVEAADRLLASNRASHDELREILRDINREDSRASQIIQRQRAMLRKREPERAPLDLNEVVRESLAILAHDAQMKHVQLQAALADEPCRVIGDRILLQQVLVNLVVNAMDAMSDVPLARRVVVVQSAMAGGVAEASVTDHGDGIAPDMLSRLFEPFVSTKAKGMGIGLTIVRGIIDAHQGTIQARNNSGGGATFWFTLPSAGVGAADQPSKDTSAA